MAVDKTLPEWVGVFPFVSDFDAVVRGQVSWEYVESAQSVLRVLVDSTADSLRDAGFTPFAMRLMLLTTTALQRCAVVQASRDLITGLADEDIPFVSGYLADLWSSVVARDGLVEWAVDIEQASVIDPVVSGLWRYYASTAVRTVQSVAKHYGCAMRSVKFVRLSGVWVESDKGVRVGDMTDHDRLLPIVSQETYRVLMKCARVSRDGKCTVVDSAGNQTVRSSVSSSDAACVDAGHGYVSLDVVLDWSWYLTEYSTMGDGSCYLLLVEPAERRQLYAKLGLCPTVGSLVAESVGVGHSWTSVPAVVTDSPVLHVELPGYCDLLTYGRDRLVGADSDPPVDLYAKALVDGFIEKYRPVAKQVQPVDAQLESMRLDTSTVSGSRRFSDASELLYTSAGKVLSPGSRSSDEMQKRAIRGATDEAVDVDGERLTDLRMRLDEGGVVDEEYYARTFRRRLGAKWRPRPKLHESMGRCVHVFAGYRASAGAGVGVWRLDDTWDVPEWTSYVARFPADYDDTIAFVAPNDAVDVRMDCTGKGSIDLGGCKMTVDGTVLWFSQSVKMRLHTTDTTVLRISVPVSGQASAIGFDLRRYLRFRGYAMVIRQFDISVRSTYESFVVRRSKRDTNVGSRIYSGKYPFDRGKHRLRLSGLDSRAPVKMVIVADPPEALQWVQCDAVRGYLSQMQLVALVVESPQVVFDVTLGDDASVAISALQVVDVKAYDLAVKASVLAHE